MYIVTRGDLTLKRKGYSLRRWAHFSKWILLRSQTDWILSWQANHVVFVFRFPRWTIISECPFTANIIIKNHLSFIDNPKWIMTISTLKPTNTKTNYQEQETEASSKEIDLGVASFRLGWNNGIAISIPSYSIWIIAFKIL